MCLLIPQKTGAMLGEVAEIASQVCSLSPQFEQLNLCSRIRIVRYAPTVPHLLEYIDMSFLKQEEIKNKKQNPMR